MNTLKSKLNTLKRGFHNNNVIFEVKVCTGLEEIAIREIKNTLNINGNDIWLGNGSVFFCYTVKEFSKVQLLRSVESVNIVVDMVFGINFNGIKKDDWRQLEKLGKETDFLFSLANWSKLEQFTGFADNIYKDDFRESDNLRFRVTCKRTGSHSFNSQIAEAQFGGAIRETFNWDVSLTNFHLNVLLDINNDKALICLYVKKLALEELEIRNMLDLGPSALKPTVAYAMLCLANIRPGDYVVDVLSDCGSLTIECLYAFKNIELMSGDCWFGKSIEAFKNIMLQPVCLPCSEVHEWQNLLNLPIANNAVDVVLLNLAHGRIFKGQFSLMSYMINREIGRIIKLGTGRIVILKRESKHIIKACQVTPWDYVWHTPERFYFSVRNVNYSLLVAYRKII